MHVAKLNNAAIAEACGLPRDKVADGIKHLLWCLLESMAYRQDVLINFGAGDLKSSKRKVDLEFDRVSRKMALITSDCSCDALPEHQMTLITSDCSCCRCLCV